MDKEKIHRFLANSAEAYNQIWDVDVNVLCTMGRRKEFRTDVGIWFIKPTRAQRRRPIANGCPLPNVWIEVIVLNFAEKMYCLAYHLVSIIIRSSIIEIQIVIGLFLTLL
jgi:hypothetical protein